MWCGLPYDSCCVEQFTRNVEIAPSLSEYVPLTMAVSSSYSLESNPRPAVSKADDFLTTWPPEQLPATRRFWRGDLDPHNYKNSHSHVTNDFRFKCHTFRIILETSAIWTGNRFSHDWVFTVRSDVVFAACETSLMFYTGDGGVDETSDLIHRPSC